MKKIKIETIAWLLLCLIVGLVGAFVLRNQPKIKTFSNEKMEECKKAGGTFSIRDWSILDDGSKYLATCKIPEHYLWKINLKK